jgi:hypothetical protein
MGRRSVCGRLEAEEREVWRAETAAAVLPVLPVLPARFGSWKNILSPPVLTCEAATAADVLPAAVVDLIEFWQNFASPLAGFRV